MSRIIRSELSVSDIVDIYSYIAQDNKTAAYELLDRIEHTITLIAASPRLGVSRPKIANGARSISIGNYSIYYRLLPDGIIILRVLHQAQDVPRKVTENH